MSSKLRIVFTIALALLPISLRGQWLNFHTPDIPRTRDGKADLAAPTPRTPDGRPDLSGLWRPEFNPYNLDVIQDVRDESVFRPEAEVLFKQHLADFHESDPITRCLPGGPVTSVRTSKSPSPR